jgi:hypothetical protein
VNILGRSGICDNLLLCCMDSLFLLFVYRIDKEIVDMKLLLLLVVENWDQT